MTTITKHEHDTAESVESAEASLEWIDLFCPASNLEAVCLRTWAARAEGRTFITDNRAIWDADALAGFITDRLPDLEDGQTCINPTDKDLRTTGDDAGFAVKLAVAWRDQVEAKAPAPELQTAWAAGRLTWSDYRTDEGRISTTADGASAVFVDPARVDLLDRLGFEAYLFDIGGWIHICETGTTTIVGAMPTARPVLTEFFPVLAAISAEAR